MPLAYTTEQLIEEVRNQFQSGDTSVLGTEDADILTYLNKEMMLEVIPQVVKLREEFFIVTELVKLTKDNTIDDTHVLIPDRAVGQTIRDLILVVGSGSNPTRFSLPRINREDLPAYEVQRDNGTEIRGFFMENYRVRVFPSVQDASTIELSYMFRPSQLVKADTYRNVTAVDFTLNTVTVSTSNPFVLGQEIDVHGPNSGGEVRVWDNEITNVNGNTLTLADPINGTDEREGRFKVEVGDYIAPREECAIPMLPREIHTMLAQAAVVRMAEAIDDKQKMEMHQRQLDRQIKLMEIPMGKRVVGRPQKVVNRNAVLWRQGTIQRRSI